jgi:peptidoglycan/LPS O-acetylase OafA/YrhL
MSRVEERRAARFEYSPAPARAQGRLTELDLLRFLAALSVLLFHYTAMRNPGWGTDPWGIFPRTSVITRYGYLGVELFFMISGFVILMTAMGRDTATFVAARITRLFPAYVFAVVLTAVIVTLHPIVGHRVTLMQVLTNLTMLQDGLGSPRVDDAYWTLWIELRFYVLIAVLCVVRVTYRSAVGFMALWLVAAVLLRNESNQFLSFVLIPMWAPYFIIGMALYLIHRYRSNVLLWGLVFAAWALAVSRADDLAEYAVRPEGGVSVTAIIWIVSGLVVVMSAMALGGLRWMRWRFLTTLGLLTYPLYLIHQVIGFVLIDLLKAQLSPQVTLAIVTSVMLVAAWLIARFIEAPAQVWLKLHFARVIAQMRHESTQRRRSIPAAPEGSS